VVVVIDPGHGGHDPGAIGRRGTREKDVVLPISLRLAYLLDNEKGFKTVLTRDRDVFLPLRERIRIAGEHKADLFVSIHADASTDRGASGSSVYILSQHGASSERARRVAERENMAGSGREVKLDDKDPMLASVLLDLAQTATINDSATFAGDVIHQIERVNDVFSPRVERAGFVVLKSPEIPSALVETAFISNPGEEHRLGTRAFRDKLAGALHQGIRTYLAANAPPGTVLAAAREREGA
jgi:N-acetylmuramoyl-L-alanine amidase